MSMENVVSRDRTSVIVFVRAFTRANHRAFERSANEKTFRFAIGINCCLWRHVRFGRAADRSSGNTCVSSKRHISALRKGADGALVIQHDYKVGHFRADLRSPTSAASTDER